MTTQTPMTQAAKTTEAAHSGIGSAGAAMATYESSPRVDILETPDEFRAEVELPGVRPEDIEVRAATSGAGWGQAQVTRRSFLGDRVQLTLALADQAPLCADVARDHPARAGDTVAVRIAPERLMPCLEAVH